MFHLFRRFLADPKSIGAITPSSSSLARAMTARIDNESTVLEIGAGSGAITRYIPNRSNGAPLVLFEQDQQLARQLRYQFGEAWVLEGFFHDTVKQLEELPENLIIVSSIPFKSISDELHSNTVHAICDILQASPGRKLIQYTYFNSPPFTPSHGNLYWKKTANVWANLPPATVWELRMNR